MATNQTRWSSTPPPVSLRLPGRSNALKHERRGESRCLQRQARPNQAHKGRRPTRTCAGTLSCRVRTGSSSGSQAGEHHRSRQPHPAGEPRWAAAENNHAQATAGLRSHPKRNGPSGTLATTSLRSSTGLGDRERREGMGPCSDSDREGELRPLYEWHRAFRA